MRMRSNSSNLSAPGNVGFTAGRSLAAGQFPTLGKRCLEYLRRCAIRRRGARASAFTHWSPRLQLTEEGQLRSSWRLPAWVHPSAGLGSLPDQPNPSFWRLEDGHAYLKSAAARCASSSLAGGTKHHHEEPPRRWNPPGGTQGRHPEGPRQPVDGLPAVEGQVRVVFGPS